VVVRIPRKGKKERRRDVANKKFSLVCRYGTENNEGHKALRTGWVAGRGLLILNNIPIYLNGRDYGLCRINFQVPKSEPAD